MECLNCRKETNNPKFCSKNCSASYNNLQREKKKRYCKNCGKLLIRKQQYCNNVCQLAYQHKEYVRMWLKGEKTGTKGSYGYSFSDHVRFYLLEKENYRCSRCGWEETNEYTGKIPLQIHHIDGNWRNNTIENLIVLCPNCHSLTSTQGGANRGNGRGSEKSIDRTLLILPL